MNTKKGAVAEQENRVERGKKEKGQENILQNVSCPVRLKKL